MTGIAKKISQDPQDYNAAIYKYAITFADNVQDGFLDDSEFAQLTKAYYWVKYFDQKTTIFKNISYFDREISHLTQENTPLINKLNDKLKELQELLKTEPPLNNLEKRSKALFEEIESLQKELEPFQQKLAERTRAIAIEEKILDCTKPNQDTSNSLAISRLSNEKTLAASQLFDLVRWDREIVQGEEKAAAIGYLKILGDTEELNRLLEKIKGVPAANVHHTDIQLEVDFPAKDVAGPVRIKETLKVQPIYLGGSKGTKQVILEAGQELAISGLTLFGQYKGESVTLLMDTAKIYHKKGRLHLAPVKGYEGLELHSVQIIYEVNPKSITEQQRIQRAASGVPTGAQALPKGAYSDKGSGQWVPTGKSPIFLPINKKGEISLEDQGMMGTWFYANNVSRFTVTGDHTHPAKIKFLVTAPQGWIVAGSGKIKNPQAWKDNAALSGIKSEDTFTTEIELSEPTMLYATGLTVYSKKTRVINLGSGKLATQFILPADVEVADKDLKAAYEKMKDAWNFMNEKLGAPPYHFPRVTVTKVISSMETRESIEISEDVFSYFGQSYIDYLGDSYPAFRDQVLQVFSHETMHAWDIPTTVFWLSEGFVRYWEIRMLESSSQTGQKQALEEILARAVADYDIRLSKEDSWPLVPPLDSVSNESHVFDETFAYSYGAAVLLFLRHELGWDKDETGKESFDNLLANWRHHAFHLVNSGAKKDKVDEKDFFKFVVANTDLTLEQAQRFRYDWVSMPPTPEGRKKFIEKIKQVFAHDPEVRATTMVRENQPDTAEGIRSLSCEAIR